MLAIIFVHFNSSSSCSCFAFISVHIYIPLVISFLFLIFITSPCYLSCSFCLIFIGHYIFFFPKAFQFHSCIFFFSSVSLFKVLFSLTVLVPLSSLQCHVRLFILRLITIFTFLVHVIIILFTPSSSPCPCVFPHPLVALLLLLVLILPSRLCCSLLGPSALLWVWVLHGAQGREEELGYTRRGAEGVWARVN